MARRNIVWFRRDLRVGDHPALNAAIAASDEIVPVFILDKTQIAEAGEKLLAYMGQSLRALDESLGNCLHIIEGDQVEVLQELIEMYGASEVHISDEYERYGAARDARVAAAGIPLVRTGSPYAVAPGRVVKPSDGTPYRVYTPFYRAWCAHGWRAPAKAGPRKATEGSSPPRRACARIILPVGTPLARAVRMRSWQASSERLLNGSKTRGWTACIC